ncbi:MAG: AMP-binding protein [Halioglobus sp.]|nr:AMP-binding protein [Halioglobus sp.]
MNKLRFSSVSQRHLGRAIQMQAEQNGDTPFIMFDQLRFTYRETNDRVNELAAGLAREGVGRGDRVAFFMDACPEVIFLVLAVNKLGAVWVPINTDYKGFWLADTIQRSRPGLLVIDENHAPKVMALGDELGDIELVVLGSDELVPESTAFDSLYITGAPEPDLSDFDYGDTCAILWTSGTTGKSKGVMQSHNVWFNACEDTNERNGTSAGDVIYNVLPTYNSAAWVTGIFRALIAGVPLAMDPHFSVSHFWERVRFYRATEVFTLGSMHILLWNAPERPDDADHTLTKITPVPMPAEIAEPFEERFGVKIMGQGMAQSEAMRVISQYNDRKPWPPGSCGTATRFVDIRLVKDNGEDAAVGEHGECWVKPRYPFVLFNGYFDDPEATRNAFEGEWYKTGDVLRKDAEDNYYFVDRKKDSVRYKGRNISTFEVELAARKHPAVADCAAFGIPSEELDSEHELKLNCVLHPGQTLSEEELASYINDTAPYFFVPRYIEFVDSLPYTPTNKVQKYKLREIGLTPETWDARRAGFRAAR